MVRFKYMRFTKIITRVKQMCIMGNGEAFGELALLFGSNRTATVETMETCYVIVIPQRAFEMYVKDALLKQLRSTVQFMKVLQFFNEMDQTTLLILASKTKLQAYEKNTLITK